MSVKDLFNKDRRAAMLFNAGSYHLKRFPRLDRLVVGENVIPGGWRRIAALTDGYESYWIDIPGAEHGSVLPIPTLYQSLATLAISHAGMLESREDCGADARDAIALGIGERVVVGAMAPRKRFDIDAEYGGELLVQLRLGIGDMKVTPGAYSPTSGEFNAAAATLLDVRPKADARPDIQII